jgi:hypothetical protein
MLDAKIQTIVDELMPLFRQFPQAEYEIAVGGAHAKGTFFVLVGNVEDNEINIECKVHQYF